jgi:hypothetical protein
LHRLLRLAGDALEANGVRFATLAGASAGQREAALHDFLHNPDCTVLTVGSGRCCCMAGWLAQQHSRCAGLTDGG